MIGNYLEKTWPSPAKLNLFLYIIGNSSNNLHILQTLVQFIDYNDYITIIPNNSNKIKLVNNIPGVAYDNNLAVRAAKLLQSYYWHNIKNALGVDIIFNKILPIGGGLGGGSSNAATVLLVLNQQWRCYLDLNVLMKLGRIIGCDVPFFLYGYTSFFEGLNNTFIPVQLLQKWYLIAVPPISVITATIFSNSELKRNSPHRSLTKLLSEPFLNDCEIVVKKYFPIIDYYIKKLSTNYASFRLTGTGACIFAEFNEEKIARYVLSLIPDNICAFVAKGMNISPLHIALSKRNNFI